MKKKRKFNLSYFQIFLTFLTCEKERIFDIFLNLI